MTLREAIHESIDQLDNDALSVVYEQIKLLQMPPSESPSPERIPTIEEVWALTSSDKSSWSDAVIEDREDRF
jgi:hypothetical protein